MASDHVGHFFGVDDHYVDADERSRRSAIILESAVVARKKVASFR
jgi:hypothetical protein